MQQKTSACGGINLGALCCLVCFLLVDFLVSCVQIVVNAIVDTLKTAFPRSEPQSPTDDNEAETDGIKIYVEKKSK